MTQQRHSIVVGGGVIGCMSAYYLSQFGWSVTILDAGRLGGGCSHGNCGFICPSHVMPLAMPGAIRMVLASALRRDSPVYLKPRFDPALWRWLLGFASRCRGRHVMQAAAARHALLASSAALYRELLAQEAIQCEWQSRGLLLVFPTPQAFREHGKSVAILREHFGVSATPYEGQQLTEFEPALKPGLPGGWHYEGDAHLRPDKLMGEMGRVLRARNVVIEEGVHVEGVAIEGGRAVGVRTSAGWRRADAIVVAAGAQTPTLAKWLGCRVPIQPGKGYSLTFPRPNLSPKTSIIFEKSHVAITPLDAALRVGSTMELAGYDRTINRRRIGLLRSAAAEYLAEPLREPAIEEWLGWRPLTCDDLPYIGPAPAAANVIVAAGNGMIGMATAAATGKLAAQLAAGLSPLIDPAPYALDRP